MAKIAEAAAKAKEMYQVMTRASEIRNWFINNGEKLTEEQRVKFVDVWNIQEKTAKEVFEFSRMF